MQDESAVFEFEKDFAQSLVCVPMSVRLKLDCCGVKLSLRQWNRLDGEDRQRLLQLSCDGEAALAAYRHEVIARVVERTGQPPGELPVEPQPEWAQAEHIPAQLSAHLQALGLPPLPVRDWARLGPVRRFALLKLSRPGHANENFVPALREFGLLT